MRLETFCWSKVKNIYENGMIFSLQIYVYDEFKMKLDFPMASTHILVKEKAGFIINY